MDAMRSAAAAVAAAASKDADQRIADARLESCVNSRAIDRAPPIHTTLTFLVRSSARIRDAAVALARKEANDRAGRERIEGPCRRAH